jgi:hypothetical protein
MFTIVKGINLAPLIPSVVNSAVIIIYSTIWKIISLKLNVMENHRTDTDFEDALISKVSSNSVTARHRHLVKAPGCNDERTHFLMHFSEPLICISRRPCLAGHSTH